MSMRLGIAHKRTMSRLTNAVFLGVEKLRVERFVRLIHVPLVVGHRASIGVQLGSSWAVIICLSHVDFLWALTALSCADR